MAAGLVVRGQASDAARAQALPAGASMVGLWSRHGKPRKELLCSVKQANGMSPMNGLVSLPQVMAALRSTGVINTTITVFTSDHQSFDKRHCYSGGSRIPLIFSWPTRILPQVTPVPHLVSHLDLFPTIVHATIGSVAASKVVEAHSLPGYSLLHQLNMASLPEANVQEPPMLETFSNNGTPRALFCEVRLLLLFSTQSQRKFALLDQADRSHLIACLIHFDCTQS